MVGNDLRLLGKHYRICPVDNPSLVRQYTIANIMEPSIYDILVEALKKNLTLEKTFLEGEPSGT